MAISFACENCGKACKVGDHLAGLTGRCGACGHMMAIPGTRVASSGGEGLGAGLKWLVGGLIAIPVMAVLLALLLPAVQAAREAARKARERQEAARAPVAPGQQPPGGMPAPIAAGPTPTPLPIFPEPGEGLEVADGVMLHEIVLGPANRPPGQGGKLWLYLPAGEHAAGSLACVLIAPAGTNLLTGMLQADSDRPEHLPYVQAGFAVLAYEIDGPLPATEGDKQPPFPVVLGAMRRFLAARAGLVNAGVALEYVLAKVPQVDPDRISAAGHSSAGTLAVLFAEHEPRLESCVAFAPALDLEEHFNAETIVQLKKVGLGDLASRYSPTVNAGKIACPLFLFHARGDSTTPVAGSEAFADRLKADGKSVTLDFIDDGDHYQSMLDLGIPRAIAWLKGTPPPEKAEKP